MIDALNEAEGLLMVGYNRRFAPMGIQIRDFMSQAGEPLSVHYRVNAGPLPSDHWVHDPDQGGGRIIGEVCHFIDYLTFLIGALPEQVLAHGIPGGEERMYTLPLASRKVRLELWITWQVAIRSSRKNAWSLWRRKGGSAGRFPQPGAGFRGEGESIKVQSRQGAPCDLAGFRGGHS